MRQSWIRAAATRLIAIQGPAAREVLQPLTAVDLGDIRYYWFSYGEVAAARVTISRTGYTGEDGFEIFVPPNMADRVWQALIECGPRRRRDSLRSWRARYAATRSCHAAVRQRHRRIDDAARGRSGLDDRVEEGRLHRARAPARAEGTGSSRARWLASRCSSAVSRGRATRHERRRCSRQGHERHADAISSRKPSAWRTFRWRCRRTGTQIDIDIRGRATKAQVVPLPVL